VETHRYKDAGKMRGCERCGGIRNAPQHGHSCTGKMIDNAAGGATCYECGRSVEKGPPIFVGDLARSRSRYWWHDRQLTDDY